MIVNAKKWIMVLAFVTEVFAGAAAREIALKSPDGHSEVVVSIGGEVAYSLRRDGRQLLAPSPISLTIAGGQVLGKAPLLMDVARRSVKSRIVPVLAEKFAVIPEVYNEVAMRFKGGYRLVFRAYDDGIAFRWVTALGRRVKVSAEEVSFQFSADHALWFPEEEKFHSHSERLYQYIPISQVTEKRMSSLPVLVDVAGGPKLAIVESDLIDYPGLYLTGSAVANRLQGKFPACAKKEETRSDRDVVVSERADYLAETGGRRAFPWRGLAIADHDADLLTNQLVYKLGRPLELTDTSWIKPGKVAWDWWNANNIFGVDFRAGINTRTYKYYIDFAASHGIEYVILDEGWYKLGNLMEINPEIDMEELARYARSKNVGLILWCIWKTLDDQLQPALDRFQRWGIRGIKVDFMQRDDQWMVNYYWKIAREAAKRGMLVDFHGSCKPTGLRRAYPNVITREGVLGLEHSKWSANGTPEHAVTLPFIRMLAGPMDYTPGAMINATRESFRPVFNRPMSQGTRCQQLAMYVVFESPLQMLADSPSHYLRQPECLAFLSRVPTVWDDTRVLQAKVGDFVALARRRGPEWYLAGMTDWTPRSLEVDFSFLDDGGYELELFCDGVNADRHGEDYQRQVRSVRRGDRIGIDLAPGGGFAGRIRHR